MLLLIFFVSLIAYILLADIFHVSIFKSQEKKIYNSIIIFLAIYASIRSFGHDYGSYQVIYETNDTFSTEYLFQKLVLICLNLKITYQGFITITALITLVGPLLLIYKYSKNFLTSLLLYIPTYYTLYSYGVMRQGMSISFALLFYYFLLEKKYLKSVIFAILSVFMHKTALLFVFFALIIILFQNKIYISSKIKIITVICLTPLLFINMSFIIQMIYNVLEMLDIHFNNYLDLEVFNISTGLSLGYFFRLFILCSELYFINKDSNEEKHYNLYFIGFILYFLLSGLDMFTGRGLALFKILDVIILANFIEQLKSNKMKTFFKIIVVLYGLFMFYINVILSISQFM